MLSEVVAETARRFGDKPLMSTGSAELTHTELLERSEVVARQLANLGVGVGSAVALRMPSGIEWAVAAVAADRVGALFAGISPVASAAERAAMTEVIRPDLILDGPADPRSSVAEQNDGPGITTSPSESPPQMRPHRELATLGKSGLFHQGGPHAGNPVGQTDVPPHDRGPQRPFAACFTSGTTGSPKAALFLERQAQAVRDIDLGATAEEIWGGGSAMISSTQFAHVGFVLKFGWYLRVGVTLHVMDRWKADTAIELLSKHHMPALGVVAPQLALILRSPHLDPAALSSLKLVIAGGAHSPASLISEACDRLGVTYSVRWSSTESGGVGLARDTEPGTEIVEGIGKPRPGVEARIANGLGEEMSPGEEGELQIRSAAMMSEYVGDPEATAAAFTPDGWLRTGDLAIVNPRGDHVLRGRTGDMYIRGGYNIHPTEVEAVLSEHPAVRSVAVTPRPDDVMGEIGLAAVVVESMADRPTLENLRDFAAGTLPRHKLPEQIRYIDNLPLTSAQKLDRRALKNLD